MLKYKKSRENAGHKNKIFLYECHCINIYIALSYLRFLSPNMLFDLLG